MADSKREERNLISFLSTHAMSVMCNDVEYLGLPGYQNTVAYKYTFKGSNWEHDVTVQDVRLTVTQIRNYAEKLKDAHHYLNKELNL